MQGSVTTYGMKIRYAMTGRIQTKGAGMSKPMSGARFHDGRVPRHA
jgi:hypothetical protein